MTVAIPDAPTRPTPIATFWVLLALVLAVHFIAGPWWALAVCGFALLQLALPFGFLPAYLMVVAGGSFVSYSNGRLTSQLALLSVGIAFMLFCYGLAMRSRAASVSVSDLSVAIGAYLSLTALNFVRGVIVGNSLRYGGLELIAALALACAFLIGNLKMTRRAIYTAIVGIVLMSLGNCVLGFREFALAHRRVGSVFFTAAPGIVALVLFNFAIRETRTRRAAVWILVMSPLLMHQFLSFTRGFWLGLTGGILYSVLAFAGIGAGTAPRWRRVIVVAGMTGGVLFAGILLIASFFGISNLTDLALSRLSSSTGTTLTFETSSNIIRLVEYARVVRDITDSPWVGHGLGYYFVVREPIHGELLEQWYCHESYLMVWLKQGIIGLLLYIGMLFTALRTAFIGSRSRNGMEAAWCGGAGAVTVFVALYSTVYFILVAEVNTAFLIALLWGGTMSIMARGHWRLRWSRPSGRTAVAEPAS